MPFNFDNSFNYTNYLAELEESGLGEDLRHMGFTLLQPVVVNGYRRKYFLSADKKFRITIDSDQVFYSINNRNNSFKNHFRNDENIIIELKYNRIDDDWASSITDHIPFRLSKNSKYVEGIQHCF